MNKVSFSFPLFLMVFLSSCANLSIFKNKIPESVLPSGSNTPFTGTFVLSGFDCEGGSVTQALQQKNSQLAKNETLVSYRFEGNITRMHSYTPFNWQKGGCDRTASEVWVLGNNNELSVSKTFGRAQAVGVQAGLSAIAQNAQSAACFPLLVNEPARVFTYSVGTKNETGEILDFTLTSRNNRISGGFCRNGSVVFKFKKVAVEPSVNYASQVVLSKAQLEAQLRKDFEPYFDEWGLVTTEPRASGGNGLLYSGEYVLLLNKLGFLKDSDKQWFQKTVKSCEVVPGLLKRSPNHPDQEGPDDYVGVVAGSAFTDRSIAERILNYGETSVVKEVKGKTLPENITLPLKYVYNNVLPGTLEFPDGRLNLEAWLGRQLGLIGHFYFGAGKKPSNLLETAWGVAVNSALIEGPEKQDSWFLSWLLLETAQSQPSFAEMKVVKDSAFLWQMKFNHLFPGGLNQIFREYFNNPDHPMARYWPSEDGNSPRL